MKLSTVPKSVPSLALLALNAALVVAVAYRSEEHTSELQSPI